MTFTNRTVLAAALMVSASQAVMDISHALDYIHKLGQKHYSVDRMVHHTQQEVGNGSTDANT